MESSRRRFLGLMGLAPVGLFAASSAVAAGSCYDPATLPLSEKNRRRSVEFVEKSDDTKRRCGLCAYFTAVQGECGTCQILGGGPVTVNGVCNSFAAKAG
ncbi:MAG TPA: high-potential iron-sulfur protein [Sphingobium sp.]|uniref:high-potential iron-sulfur protein n=1 Tax=Sphingobium sp. TaxID=1912891 RepID=UPI002ED46AD5